LIAAITAIPQIWDRIIAIGAAIGALGAFATILVTIHLAKEQLTEQRDEARIVHMVEESNKFEGEPILTTRKILAERRIDRRSGKFARPSRTLA
jgi:hypothetical protein